MAGKSTAIDLGSHTVKLAQVKAGKHGLVLQRFAAFPTEELAAGLAAAGIPLKGAVAGLAGRDMNLRYTQVPPSPDWQLRNLMELEIQDMATQTGGALSADYNLMPVADEEGGTETVLLAFARDEALERAAGAAAGAGGSIDAHVPNCIALYNAFVRCGPVEEDATVCIVSLGRETIDLAISKGVDLLFVRNLSSGGKVFDDAIAQQFDVSERKAEALKKDLLDLDPFSRGRYASGQAEKVTMAAGGAGSVIVSAIQSSLAFCRSQTKNPQLQLDKVLVCGGTSRTRGIRGMLREALRCPVEPFDPFERVDLSELPAADVEALERHRAEAVTVLGLAAGRVDESLYQLEILPERVKRRRKFLQQTVWNIGAGLIAVGLIAWFALGERQRAGAIDTALQKLTVQKNRLANLDKETEELVAANANTRALCDALAERAVPLDGLLLAMRAIHATLPEELWITSIEVRKSADRSKRGTGEPRSVVVVKGKGKDLTGREVHAAYTSFLTAFKQHGHDGVTPLVTPVFEDAQGTFTLTIDYRPAPTETPGPN
ncbi:MAG: pilus assembly protein PilM [Planctomycetes bacterium]|nr:pilus assembly protein PilM [Planctomycetota bacterium]